MTTNKEPAFWESYLSQEPICKEIVSDFENIKRDVLKFKEKHPKFFVDYPKFKVTNPDTQQPERLYQNDWKVTAFSKFDEDYNEVGRVGKRLGDSVQSLIERYVKRDIPTTYELVQKHNLTNVFVSVLSPGSVIRPHQGHSKKYMRIHMGLICDPECKITVGDETKTWKEGQILAFKDGGPYYHSVVHNGTQDRYIFSFDLSLEYLTPYITNY
jgi:hypothetical protein